MLVIRYYKLTGNVNSISNASAAPAALLHHQNRPAGERQRRLFCPAVAAEVEAAAVRLWFYADGRGRVARVNGGRVFFVLRVARRRPASRL